MSCVLRLTHIGMVLWVRCVSTTVWVGWLSGFTSKVLTALELPDLAGGEGYFPLGPQSELRSRLEIEFGGPGEMEVRVGRT